MSSKSKGANSVSEDPTCDIVNLQPEHQMDSSPIGYLVQFLMFVLGLCTLTSWNVFMTTFQYFLTELTGPEGYQNIFVPSVTTTQNIAMLVANILIIVKFYKYSLVKKIFISIVVVAIGFLVFIGIGYADMKTNRFGLLAMIVALAFVLGSASTFMQTSAFSLLTNFPFAYTNAFLIGQGFAGTFVTLLLIICISTGMPMQATNTMFFVLTVLICVATFMSFMYILKTPVYTKYVLSKSPSNYKLLKPTGTEVEVGKNSSSDESPNAVLTTDIEPKKAEADNNVSQDGIVADTIAIWKCIWIELLSIYLGFAVLIAYFPVFGSFMQSHVTDPTSAWATKYFFLVVVLMSFNLGDLAGRLLTKVVIYPDPHSIGMLIVTASRILFIIPLYMCKWRNHVSPLNNILNHDIFPFMIFFLFALSNGYLTTACLSKANNHLPDKLKEKGGTMCILLLGLGLFTGSLISFGTQKLGEAYPTTI